MIIELGYLFNDYTLNVFTDASVNKNSDGTFDCCSGCTLYHGNTVVSKTQVLLDSTNNQAEIYAILMGINAAIEYTKENSGVESVNLFSDSKISIFGLREWITNWSNNVNEKVMYSSSGQPVKNQSIFLDCIYKILDNNFPISLYHVHGHKNPDINKHVEEFKRNFEKYNYLQDSHIDINLTRKLMKCNEQIDWITRETLRLMGGNVSKNHQNGFNYYKDMLMYPVYREGQSLQPYLNLINNRKLN